MLEGVELLQHLASNQQTPAASAAKQVPFLLFTFALILTPSQSPTARHKHLVQSSSVCSPCRTRCFKRDIKSDLLHTGASRTPLNPTVKKLFSTVQSQSSLPGVSYTPKAASTVQLEPKVGAQSTKKSSAVQIASRAHEANAPFQVQTKPDGVFVLPVNAAYAVSTSEAPKATKAPAVKQGTADMPTINTLLATPTSNDKAPFPKVGKRKGENAILARTAAADADDNTVCG